jgi:hypothetical protein
MAQHIVDNCYEQIPYWHTFSGGQLFNSDDYNIIVRAGECDGASGGTSRVIKREVCDFLLSFNDRYAAELVQRNWWLRLRSRIAMLMLLFRWRKMAWLLAMSIKVSSAFQFLANLGFALGSPVPTAQSPSFGAKDP